MIIGKLRDLKRYKGISKNIDTAIDYVLNHDLLTLPRVRQKLMERMFMSIVIHM